MLNEIFNLSYNLFDYRIKPESKYRPFKDAEECWNEMQKHQPVGWVKPAPERAMYRSSYALITDLWSSVVYISGNNNEECYYENAVNDYTFADGTPFGIKEEK